MESPLIVNPLEKIVNEIKSIYPEIVIEKYEVGLQIFTNLQDTINYINKFFINPRIYIDEVLICSLYCKNADENLVIDVFIEKSGSYWIEF